MKNDREQTIVHVSAFTTTEKEKDIFRKYKMHVSCVMSKPLEFEPFFNLIRGIEDFWFTNVAMPKSTK